MNKTKWIVGLSLVGVMVLSSTAFALTSGSVAGKSVGQILGVAPIVTTQNQGNVADKTTTPSSPNNSNAVTTPGSNGNGGGYGMIGGGL